MKSISFICFAVLCFILCSLCCFADSFQDPCESEKPSVSRTLHNLSNANESLENDPSFSIDDLSALTVSDLTDYGQITYAVEDVEEVTVSLYRRLASFAVKGEDGVLRYNALPDSSEKFDLLPLFLDENTDAVYCIDNGISYLLCYDEMLGDYTFLEQESVPENLVPYGLEIQESFDGLVFDPVEAERIHTRRHVNTMGDILFDETFHANLSSHCRYLRIKVKQYSQIATASSENITGSMDVMIGTPTMLRNVIVVGEERPPLNPDGDSSLPDHEDDTSYGDKDKYDKDDDKKKPSSQSSSKSSSSSKLPDSHISNTTSSHVENSSTRSTTDSNNDTTSYTTNNYYINLSPQAAQALEEMLQDLTAEETGKFPEETADKISAELLPQEETEVIYDDTTIGESAPATSSESAPPSEIKDTVLYCIIFGISAVIVLQVIIILKSRAGKHSSEEDSDQSDDDI